METALFDILKSTGGPTVILLMFIIFVTKFYPKQIEEIKNDIKSDKEKIEKTFKDLEKTINTLNISVARLETQIESFVHALERTSKLEKDMNEAFSTLREIKNQRDN